MKRNALLLLLGLSLSLLAPRAEAVRSVTTPEMQKIINVQIQHELDAAYLYLDMANHFDQRNLFGFGHWFTIQFHEEIIHARLMMKFLTDKGKTVELYPLTPPASKYKSYSEITATALKAEEDQTKRVEKIYETARETKAYDAETLYSIFVREQVQEEADFNELNDKVKLVEKSPEGLLALDRELAKRKMPVVQPLPSLSPFP